MPSPRTIWNTRAAHTAQARPVTRLPRLLTAKPIRMRGTIRKRLAYRARSANPAISPMPTPAYSVAAAESLPCSSSFARNTIATSSTPLNATTARNPNPITRTAFVRQMYPRPSRASRMMLCPDGTPGGSFGSRLSNNADAANVAASMNRIPRTSVTRNNAAAINGPIASSPFVPAPSAEFAVSRSSSRTSAGTALRELAWNTCATTLRRATSTSSTGNGGNVTAITITNAPCATSHPTITRRRSNRSPTTPANAPNTPGVRPPASNNNATANAAPVDSSTYSNSATRLSESPRNDTDRATHNTRNPGASRSTPIPPPPIP